MPVYHAFFYRNGASTDLGTLQAGRAVLPAASTPRHCRRMVAGHRRTTCLHLRRANGMRDLNSLIAATSGWTLETAVAVNDAGQIAGMGWLNGQRRIFLLTPSQTDADSNGWWMRARPRSLLPVVWMPAGRDTRIVPGGCRRLPFLRRTEQPVTQPGMDRPRASARSREPLVGFRSVIRPIDGRAGHGLLDPMLLQVIVVEKPPVP